MARKYDLISELYNRTCKTVVSNPQNWQAFLASACRNYKLRYDEQLLVYAQRPDATAVLEIEQWNRIFGRWVNRGARGIAVFADENRTRQRLTHYFDISDTHESRYSRTVPIWDMANICGERKKRGSNSEKLQTEFVRSTDFTMTRIRTAVSSRSI